MAVIEGGGTAALQEVDTTFKAARATLRPFECLSWNSVGAATGLLTTVAAAGAIFSLRNIGANPLIIRRLGIGFVTTTAFTAAQRLEFSLAIARSFSASDTGGTAIALTGNNCKHRTSLGTVTSIDCRIATTAALTAGTKTLDTNRMGYQAFWAGAIGATLLVVPDNLLSHNAGDYPIVLAQNEGLNVVNEVVMGAAGVGVAYINMEFAEATSF